MFFQLYVVVLLYFQPVHFEKRRLNKEGDEPTNWVENFPLPVVYARNGRLSWFYVYPIKII